MGEVLGPSTAAAWSATAAPLAVGIGIHTGPLVAGYIGSSKALSYTVIGDVANTSRACAPSPSRADHREREHLRPPRGRFEVRGAAPAKVKGKEKPLRIYNVLRRAALVPVPEEVSPRVDDRAAY
jgi:adenylate cyclase